MSQDQYTDWFEVMDRLQRGDRLALLQVTRLITGYLTRFQAYQLRDSWDDLCQEVLMATIKSVNETRISHPNAFVSYVGMITRNKLADWIQAQRRAGNDSLLGDPDAARDILDSLQQDEETHRRNELLDLQQAIDRLPEKEKSVVTSVYLEGQSYEESAKQHSMPLGTLKRLQTNGLKLLRAQLGVRQKKYVSDSPPTSDLNDKPPNSIPIRTKPT